MYWFNVSGTGVRPVIADATYIEIAFTNETGQGFVSKLAKELAKNNNFKTYYNPDTGAISI